MERNTRAFTRFRWLLWDRMESLHSEQQRQLRQLAGRKRRQVVAYVSLGLLAAAAVAVSIYAMIRV